MSHQITPALKLSGLETHDASLLPRAVDSPAITRPVIANLPPMLFPLVGLATLAPFFALGLRKVHQRRSGETAQARRELRSILARLDESEFSELYEGKIIPWLKVQHSLPAGATPSELADELEPDAPELARQIREHANASFRGQALPLDKHLLKTHLKTFLTVTFILGLSLSMDASNQGLEAFEEGRLSDALAHFERDAAVEPGQPTHHLNAAKTLLALGRHPEAQAAATTASLLSPWNADAAKVTAATRTELGQPSLGLLRRYSLRPDQWLSLAALFWCLAAIVLSYRVYRKARLRFPEFVLAGLVLMSLGLAAQAHYELYQPGQFMVIAPELPREIRPGNPDWQLPTFSAGEIIIGRPSNEESHIIVGEGAQAFWLPTDKLRKIW